MTDFIVFTTYMGRLEVLSQPPGSWVSRAIGVWRAPLGTKWSLRQR